MGKRNRGIGFTITKSGTKTTPKARKNKLAYINNYTKEIPVTAP
jgi:hypothetical protein